MKNISTPKKKKFKTTATFCEVEVAVGCWVLSLSTNYRDLSALVSSAALKKGCLFRHTSKTQGIGVGDRSRKMVVSRSLGSWSRFAHHCCTASSVRPLLLHSTKKIGKACIDNISQMSNNFREKRKNGEVHCEKCRRTFRCPFVE
jgi:hypothetical protein